MVKIYTLKDPITFEIRYVGKTKNSLKNRWYAHCSNYFLTKSRSKKNSWILKLKRLGHKPIIELLEEVEESDWEFWESYWISQFLNWGFNLTNMTSGGEGCNGGSGSLGYKHSQETKQRISIANSKPKTQEWINNVAQAVRKTVSKNIIQLDLEGNTIKEWVSFYEAAEHINIEGKKESTIKNIHACCNNKRKTAYGYVWKYKKV